MSPRRARVAAGLSVIVSVAGLSVLGTSTTSAAPAVSSAAVSSAAAPDRVAAVTRRTGNSVSIAPAGVGRATAKCRRSEVLVGGGAIGDGTSSARVFLRASAPDPGHPRRWLARGFNNDFAVAHDLTAYAFCAMSARRDRVGVIVRSGGPPKELGALAGGRDTAACRQDERLVGGGAVGSGTATASTFLAASAPDPTRSRRWIATAFNNDDADPQELRAFAYCARPARPDRVERVVRRAGDRVTVAATTEGTASATCRRGDRLIGGGAISDAGTALAGVLLTSSGPHPSNPRRWRAVAYNWDAGADHGLRVVALCARR